MHDKPFSQACENNKGPILAVLQQHLRGRARLLEVGSGTGQHAAWLSGQLPAILWQPSDVAANLPGIRAWCDDTGHANLLPPICLDVRDSWPDGPYDAIFTANTFHIMSRTLVQRCIGQAAQCLAPDGQLFVYGPFNYQGQFTSASNARFNDWLQQRDPDSAIRDIEWVCEQMQAHGLRLQHDHAMPANNRLLVFGRGVTVKD